MKREEKKVRKKERGRVGRGRRRRRRSKMADIGLITFHSGDR